MPPRKYKTKARADPESRLGLLPPSFPGNANGKGLNQSQWDGCRAILEGVLVAKQGNRYMGDIFCVLPTREELPEYYAAIPEPESLDHICVSIQHQDSLKRGYEMLTCALDTIRGTSLSEP